MGDYVDIGPVHMWYEVRGAGEPLVLLHGGLDTNASWGAQIDTLAKHFRVVAPERRGHGHTPDVDGPVSYGVMADDTAAFIDTVVGTPVYMVGWSDGAIVGLLIALRRPDLVRKLVLIGGNADVSAYVPQFYQAARLPADSEVYHPFRAVYDVVSPDGPDHWPVVFSKITAMWQTEPQIPLTDLEAIQARALVVVGDDDLITLEHTIALYRALRNAELAVVPGASHLSPMEKPDLVNHLLLEFLRQDPVPTLMPVRRAAAPAPA
jgi:pimeloyl-ACP methyl ester carboxylesterase